MVLTGPNGYGKSAIFEAFNSWRRQHGGFGFRTESDYFSKVDQEGAARDSGSFEIRFHESDLVNQQLARKSIKVRSAYRHETDFRTTTLNKVTSPTDDQGLSRLIEPDHSVRKNYEYLAGATVEALYAPENQNRMVEALRTELVGRVADAMTMVFEGELSLQSPGNPLVDGAFYFGKGTSQHFHFKNLSGGERAAFDLVLDLALHASTFDDTVFCIDEPELHLGTRTQGLLLKALLGLISSNSQLWIATHSIGMMRTALQIGQDQPGDVAFLDLGNTKLDEETHITPSTPSRKFWLEILATALDDMAELVGPRRVVLCEGGNPQGGADAEGFDARCYRAIFGESHPDTEFISVGNADAVRHDHLGVGRAVTIVTPAAEVVRVIDRDNRSDDEVNRRREEGTRVLSKRSIEGYLLADEILTSFCEQLGKPDRAGDMIAVRDDALKEAVGQGKPPDDFKSAGGAVHVFVKKELGEWGLGSDARSFMVEQLAPLISPGTQTHADLSYDIFGTHAKVSQ